MEIFIVWVIFAVLVGAFASNRGRSGIGWGLLSLVLSPLIIFIILLVIPDLEKLREQESFRRAEEDRRSFDQKREHEKQLESLKVLRQAPTPPAASRSVADEIAKLGALLEKGLLTEEEFKAQKAALLQQS